MLRVVKCIVCFVLFIRSLIKCNQYDVKDEGHIYLIEFEENVSSKIK